MSLYLFFLFNSKNIYLRYTLTSFELHNTILLAIFTVLYSTYLTHSCGVTETIPIEQQLLISPKTPAPGNHYYILSFCEFHCFRYFIEVEDWSFHDWLISLAQCPSSSSILLQMSGFFYGWVIFCCVYISIHLFMNTGCFHIFAIVNNTVMIMGVMISLEILVSIFWWHTQKLYC